MMIKRFTIVALVMLAVNGLLAQQVSIIPEPVSMQPGQGSFLVNERTVITASKNDQKSAAFLRDYLHDFYGISLQISTNKAKSNAIAVFTKAPGSNSAGAYTLQVLPTGVTVNGDTYAGTFYGIQSLIQLLPVEKKASLQLPAISIVDSPRFSYRGMHLDVGRHFFPVSFVKKYIDYIALHKMNYFHWHLTEDQGWRIEIKKYPRLTEIGGCRNGTIIGHYPGTGNDSTQHCGYYTQEEIKEVVKYATDRFVTVVPEIEMPGHAEAALTSYPWLGCPGTGPYKVEGTWGVFDDVYCAGKDSTFKFLENVLDEVLTLFPSKYIHIGGDELPKTNWKVCPLCQARIKAEGLKDEHELQSYFIQRIEKYLNNKGRSIIGWDEILEGGLAPNATVMSWRGEAGGIEAAKQGHDVIMTPGGYVYFDHSQVAKDDLLTIGGNTSVEKVYAYEPVPAELTPTQAQHILGAQANVWTEYMQYPSKVEYMIFPRMSALSEVLWSPKDKRNWATFEPKLQQQFKRYDIWNAHHSKASRSN